MLNLRRGSYDDNTATRNPLLQNYVHRRSSAPSLEFTKAWSKPWLSSNRENPGCLVPVEQCPFVLGLTDENSELIITDSVVITEGMKTTARHLFLFSSSLVVAKLKSSTTFKLKHKVDLSDLWIVYSEEKEEDKDTSYGFTLTCGNAIILRWSTNVCIASFSSLGLKELWLDTIRGQTREIKGAKITKVASIKFLMKVLSSCNAPKTLDVSDMETLIGCQSEVDIKKCHLFMPCDTEDGLCHLSESSKKRKKVISWPFLTRRITSGPEILGQLEPDLKPSLFDQPLSMVCNKEDMLPKPIQDILTILFLQGPYTEGIFRKAANEKLRKELKEELNSGGNVAFEKASVHLLAVVFKDFLRNIPHKLLLSELYDDWMTAVEKTGHHEKTEAIKEVASKLPRPNLLLLKHLLCVLHHISKSSEVNKMDSSNLAICFGPTMLTSDYDQGLPLAAQKEQTDKVKTLVEFLINNCCDIFGEEICLLFTNSVDDSLDKSEMLSASQLHDSAYDSTDPEGECSSNDLQPSNLSKTSMAASRLSSRELYPQRLLEQTSYVSSLTRFKLSISNLDRRFSEPDMFSSKSSRENCVRDEMLTKSEENVIQQKELGLKCQNLRMYVMEEPPLPGLYRTKKPLNLTIKASLQSELSSGSLPRSSSSSSLDSLTSVSDNSVFSSSPLASPSLFKNNTLIQPQSLSTNISEGSGTHIGELKKHSVSFSATTRKKLVTKTQSCSLGSFQRDSFKKESKKERHLSCRIVQATYGNKCKPVTPLEHQHRSRFMSAEEVFQLVDRRNPGKPPSYEEATKNCTAARLPSYGSLAVQDMRPTTSFPDSGPQHSRFDKEVTNKVYKDFLSNRLSVINNPKDSQPAVDFVIGIHPRANIPLTPQVYRLRTMSGSYQKSKQEYLMRRCSQPAFDCIQCAKESYV
ncbi:T-cell activation Rho GTPase-activating protein isoform X1 [Anolis carolinensis]|uniref:T-cell activation Rho GTPase-activating protein isoform X1 n=1 Tax=Anolis carolinensis TaxID=28377 RepID=UPI002F2B6D6C